MEEQETALVRTEPARLTVQDIRADINLIQEVMRGVMHDGEHYGRIPGCGPKPTLLKPGAEKISAVFRLGPEPEILQVIDTQEEYTVTVRVRLIHGPSGTFCGCGIGACSSREEKYGWRVAVCQDEYDATPENRRRVKWRKGGGKDLQVATDPKTQMNTVLKMAKKRAYVDAVLSATAASDIFTQDLEDLGPQDSGGGNGQPRAAPAGGELAQKWESCITRQAMDGVVNTQDLEAFLQETAEASGQGPDRVRARAVKNWSGFWAAYQKARKPHDANEKAPPVASEGEAGTQVSPEPLPRQKRPERNTVMCPSQKQPVHVVECDTCQRRETCEALAGAYEDGSEGEEDMP